MMQSLDSVCSYPSVYSGDRADISKEQVDRMGVLASTMFAEMEAGNLMDKGHHVVVIEPFRTSLFAVELRSRGTNLTGTLHTNRKGFKSDDILITVERGSVDYGSVQEWLTLSRGCEDWCVEVDVQQTREFYFNQISLWTTTS